MSVAENLGGNVLICMFIAAVLNGVTLTQALYYYQTYPDDRRSLKLVVAAISALESLHTVFCVTWAYVYLIKHFGHPDIFDHIYWTISTTIVIGIIVAGIVHCYYVRRVWYMSNQNKPLTASIALLAIMRFAFGMTVAILCYYIPYWSTFRMHKYSDVTVGLALSSAAAVDILAAISLIYYLHTTRPSSNLKDSRVNMLTVYIINTGLITSIFSLLILVTFMALHSNLVFLAFIEIQSRLYANSFLASLNARQTLRNKGVNVQFSSYDFGDKPGSPTPARIRVVKETVKTIDEPSESPHERGESLLFKTGITEDSASDLNEKNSELKITLSSNI
ncbi:hypothetical protein GLOTRDRAFT_126309 [Gloeophyllum trabeum ATCC 11539]|uniref:DUF6534 domain-containing protein n=1 Tax=Gloeophyllum trabeum (strain ATCC 11539 / FP-39264 / Madison 617) TaxID=670483 RepID=S7QEU0_GLOTA|nr:uncharacterized protein GLOTRDRAFT_126309 [Gloeophyllum trabeum ATCC 11539]EPQ57818.1 hypothetical protein GLOTRDRAFT_126309 [Gloeophyllum trabeum ATCC 11539]